MTKIVELIIDDEALENEDGVFAISLVNQPAIQANFIALKKASKNIEVKFNELDADKQLLIGAVLIPDKQILRVDPETGSDYYVYFTKATIRKASELFFMRDKQHNHTIEHQKEVTNLTVVESWIKDGKLDKSYEYGFKDLPIGTWFVSVKVNDRTVWDKYVKTGKVQGFSIEGFFTDRQTILSEDENILNRIRKVITESGL
jgi:hypothetical protein|tara:strand:+ start:52 stop:657 length:606 start_codon:yes stop_codon:yes gene_type:complete